MKLILTITIAFLLAGCMATKGHYDPKTGMNQTHTYDNSILNTSSKLTQYQQCDKNKEQPENCKLLGMYHSDTTGLIPSVGGQSIQGIAIGVGLGSSDGDINTVGGSTAIDKSCQGNCGGNPR